MIENLAIAGGGLVSSLVLARWLWRIHTVARWARIVAIVIVLMVAGAVAGVVDVGRLVELASAAARLV